MNRHHKKQTSDRIDAKMGVPLRYAAQAPSSAMASSRNSLEWVKSRRLSYFKHSSTAVQMVLYSSQGCGLCQRKLVPLFEELAAWPQWHWVQLGYKAGVPLLFSAIDTSTNERPRQSESRDVARVPCVQMWAPAGKEYAPKLYCYRACIELDYAPLRSSLVRWIVKHANGI